MTETAQFYQFTKEKLFSLFKTSDKGLSVDDARKRLEEEGPNKLTSKKKISPFSIYASQFKNTLTLILIAAAVLVFFIYFFGEREQSDLIEGSLILGMVFLITFLGFVQEYKAERAIESLKKLLAFKARVRRNGQEIEIDVASLVPGDIVILEEGERVPADIRLLEVFELKVNEASLTGESAAVSKNDEDLSKDAQISDQINMVFAGTSITSGRAVGMVVATGDKTEIGKIAKSVADVEKEATPIQKKLSDIGKILGYVVIGISLVVFVFIVFFAEDFADQMLFDRIIHSFIASVALAVAAIPEGLPAVVTISLALGTQRMLKKNALVRKLNSVETLGSVDVICSDKTGTLTKGEMTVRKVYFDGKTYEVTGTGYQTQGGFEIGGKKVDSIVLAKLFECGVFCNNASIKNGKLLGDPTEAALLVSAAKAGVKTKGKRLFEIPFSSERKMMSVVVEKDNKYFVYTKGAVEEVLNHSSISLIEKKKILDTNIKLSSDALRGLGFAYKEISKSDFTKQKNNPQKLESGLIFLGIQAMIDPPRIEVEPLIKSCQESGIRVVMITGDHIDTARAVAKEIGITGEGLTGLELEKMNDSEFIKTVESISIYARVNPNTKMRIVSALKKKGHIVAMTGDGVNDAPALKKSDIGIAMGITGTDVAKESADMVLLDDKFSTIVASVEEGRGIFHNIRKFVTYLLSCNVGEVMLVFVSVIIFQKLPLSATILLWINVVTDGIPAVALGLDPSEKNILSYKPKAFQADIITPRLWVEIIVFGILLTIGSMGIFLMDLPLGIERAMGATFTAVVMFEMVAIYLIRADYKTGFFSNPWLLVSVVTTVIIQIVIVYTPFLANLFGIKPIDVIDWIYIIATSGLLWLLFKLAETVLDRFESFKTDSRGIVEKA